MFTTDTFAHGHKTSLFTSHCSDEAKRLLLWNAILVLTKQGNHNLSFWVVRNYAFGECINHYSAFQ